MENFIESAFGIFFISTLRYFIIAGLVFFLFYKVMLGKFSNAKIQAKHAGSKDFIHEVLHSIQSTGVMSLIAAVVLFTPLRSYTKVYADIERFGIWYMVLSVFLALVVHDTYFYWMHRLLHHPRLFKYAHLTHHKSTNPSPWTSYSFHIIEAAVEGAVLIVLVLVLPMHRFAIMGFVLLGFMINVYGHLGYEIMPKWFRGSILFRWINTSIYHNLHHSKFKGNYGLYFRFWDRLMGTETPNYVKEYDRIQNQRFL
ncbi:MAG: sterol desaturase family protein [Pedobacter sp.]|nr:sterol desaturase family protein [Pedobacter sp.]